MLMGLRLVQNVARELARETEKALMCLTGVRKFVDGVMFMLAQTNTDGMYAPSTAYMMFTSMDANHNSH